MRTVARVATSSKSLIGSLMVATTVVSLACSQPAAAVATRSPSPVDAPTASPGGSPPGPPSAAASPSGSASPSPTSQPPPTACVPGSSYGLLIGPALSTASLPRTAVLPSAGLLEIINTCGLVVMSTPLGAASVQNCAAGSPNAFQTPASLQVPVSASADRVYYRDGDTRIRWLTPNGQTGDAATVPGGPATISFFSVSPDDQRIAVVVADFSPASTINQRLYVEDLSGGGHHVDLYTTSTPKGGDGSILWPMGWHQGRLVVAVLPACGYPQESLSPSAWHVVDASTGNRLVAITSTCGDGISGTLSSGRRRLESYASTAARASTTGPGSGLASLRARALPGINLSSVHRAVDGLPPAMGAAWWRAIRTGRTTVMKISFRTRVACGSMKTMCLPLTRWLPGGPPGPPTLSFRLCRASAQGAFPADSELVLPVSAAGERLGPQGVISAASEHVDGGRARAAHRSRRRCPITAQRLPGQPGASIEALAPELAVGSNHEDIQVT